MASDMSLNTVSLGGAVTTATAAMGQMADKAGVMADKAAQKIATLQDGVILTKDSIALSAVVSTAEKNKEYISHDIVYLDPQILISRAYYCETGFVSFFSLLHNLALTLIFGVCAGIYFGANKSYNYHAKRFLLLTAVSGVSTGISIAGVVSPSFADKVQKLFIEFLEEYRTCIYNFLGTEK